jgi:hypothetical protein
VRPLLGHRSPAELAHLARAKRRLDTLGLRPRPVDLRRVRIVHAPWWFRLPVLRRFSGYALGPLILLRRPPEATSNDLVTHELCHVWQAQDGLPALWLSYLWEGYRDNRHEVEARAAAALTRDVP